MTHSALKEWAEAPRPRYQAATREHRRNGVWTSSSPPKPRGRPAVYQGGALLSALLIAGEASGYVWGQDLAPALSALAERLEQWRSTSCGGSRPSIPPRPGATSTPGGAALTTF